MLETLFKAILSIKSRVTLQLGILSFLLAGSFYAGSYAREFTAQQAETNRQQAKIAESIHELVERSRDSWTYQMHKDYSKELEKNPGLIVPNVAEIRERYSN